MTELFRRLAPLILRGLLLLALVALPSRGWAEPEGLREARNRFDFGQYDAVIAGIDKLNEQHLLTTETELTEAWRLHALASYYLGKRPEARASFLKLLKTSPDYTLDPIMVPPGALELLEQVRVDQKGLLDQIRAQRQAIEAAKPQPAGPPETRELRFARHPFALNFVPFGIPQFDQGRPTTGTILAIGQGTALLASVGTWVAFRGLRHSDGTFSPGDIESARRLRTFNWLSVGLGLALYAGGTIDALLHHQAETPLPSPNPKPAEPSARLMAGPAPGSWAGITLGLEGSF